MTENSITEKNYILDSLIGEQVMARKSGEYLLGKIKSLFPVMSRKVRRLDLHLYTSIYVKENMTRIASLRLLYDEVVSKDVNLKPLSQIDISQDVDGIVLQLLNGSEIKKQIDNLDQKTKVITEKIAIENICKGGESELSTLEKAIIKAMIIHDYDHNVLIKSHISGRKNVHQSVRVALNKMSKGSGWNDAPEALSAYWGTRFMYVFNVVLGRREEYKEMFNLQMTLSEVIFKHVELVGLENMEDPAHTLMRFARSLGYEIYME